MSKRPRASKLPKEGTPMKLDPFLAVAIEEELSPYDGAKLKRAQKAVLDVSKSGFTGTFGDLVVEYRRKIGEAVAA